MPMSRAPLPVGTATPPGARPTPSSTTSRISPGRRSVSIEKETAAMTMSKRQAAFRADYRLRVSPWYGGIGHVALIYAIGIPALWYYIPHIHRPTLGEWLIRPAAFLFAHGLEGG